jgi:hypothetical protein
MSEAQSALWCACGRDRINSAGVCPTCSRRARLSREKFGGLREEVLERDQYRCVCCGAIEDLLVHHRRQRNRKRELVTLRRACHTRVHRTRRPGFSFPDFLRELWREAHPGQPEQLCLQLSEKFGQLTGEQPALFEAAA